MIITKDLTSCASSISAHKSWPENGWRRNLRQHKSFFFLLFFFPLKMLFKVLKSYLSESSQPDRCRCSLLYLCSPSLSERKCKLKAPEKESTQEAVSAYWFVHSFGIFSGKNEPKFAVHHILNSQLWRKRIVQKLFLQFPCMTETNNCVPRAQQQQTKHTAISISAVQKWPFNNHSNGKNRTECLLLMSPIDISHFTAPSIFVLTLRIIYRARSRYRKLWDKQKSNSK